MWMLWALAAANQEPLPVSEPVVVWTVGPTFAALQDDVATCKVAPPGVRSVAEAVTNPGTRRPGTQWAGGAPLDEAAWYLDGVFVGTGGVSPLRPTPREPEPAAQGFGRGLPPRGAHRR